MDIHDKKLLNADDLKSITGLSKSKCYQVIRELNQKLKEERPDVIIIDGRVSKKYAEDKLYL